MRSGLEIWDSRDTMFANEAMDETTQEKKVNNMRTGERTYKASQRQVRKLGDDAQEGSFPEERPAKHNYDAGLKFSK